MSKVKAELYKVNPNLIYILHVFIHYQAFLPSSYVIINA